MYLNPAAAFFAVILSSATCERLPLRRQATTNSFCASVTSAISSASDQAAATSFCSSYLNITTATVTATGTATDTVSATTTVTSTTDASPTATTVVTETLKTRLTPTAISVTFTSTKSVLGPSFTCTPGFLGKRAAQATPVPFATLSSANLVSSACECLSIPTPTSTVSASHTITQTVTGSTTVVTTVSGGTKTYTFTTTKTRGQAFSYVYSTITTTTTLGADAAFLVQVIGADGSNNMALKDSYEDAPQDFFYGYSLSGADFFELQGDNCELYDSSSFHTALQTFGGLTGEEPPPVYPSGEYGRSGEAVTCHLNPSTFGLDCQNPFGGEQAYICIDVLPSGFAYSKLYLGLPGLENSTCSAVDLMANLNPYPV